MRFRYLQKEKEVHAVNGVFCPLAYRRKLQYESEEKALNAIKFGNGDIIRAYYCKACGCWHTTSKPDKVQPWVEMSSYITDLYHIDTEDMDANETQEEENMVFVKIVENDALGKVALPGYFPVGVLAKRFGYTRQVTTDSVTRMTDINVYVVLDEGKLVVKNLSERDREGFLRSFAARMEEEFEATNVFTMEHEIFPKDIVLEDDVEANRPTPPVVEAEELRELVESKVEKVVKQDFTRLDPQIVQGDFDRDLAEKSLHTAINYYLQEVELKTIDLEQNQYPLSSLAVRGKGLLTYAVAEHFSNLSVLEKLLSNESMQLALGRLGFYEFLEVDAHLAALFFEVLYAAAALQGKHEIRRRLESILVGGDQARPAKVELVFHPGE